MTPSTTWESYIEISLGACLSNCARSGGCGEAPCRAQVIRPAYPDAAFKGLKADAHTFGAACGLRSTGNFSVREIGLDQINQRSARFTDFGRRQSMRQNARLDLVAPRRMPQHRSLEFIEHHQDGTQCVVRHIAGTPGAAHEFQV